MEKNRFPQVRHLKREKPTTPAMEISRPVLRESLVSCELHSGQRGFLIGGSAGLSRSG